MHAGVQGEGLWVQSPHFKIQYSACKHGTYLFVDFGNNFNLPERFQEQYKTFFLFEPFENKVQTWYQLSPDTLVGISCYCLDLFTLSWLSLQNQETRLGAALLPNTGRPGLIQQGVPAPWFGFWHFSQSSSGCASLAGTPWGMPGSSGASALWPRFRVSHSWLTWWSVSSSLPLFPFVNQDFVGSHS